MKNLPSMKQLQYLAALAEYRHFGQAAESCFVTQSTLSAGIRDLEDLLQAKVAERTNRSVMLTPLGERLAAMGKTVLRLAEDMVDVAHQSSEFLTGALRLGVIPTIGPYLLPRVLPAIHRQYPNLELFLREDYTDRLLEQLKDGTLDVILIALPYDTNGMDSLTLFSDGFVLACPEYHSLAGRKSLDIDAFADEPLLLLEEGHCLRRHALEACRLEGRDKAGNFEATSMPTLVQMVAMGMGLTLLPQLAVDAGIANGLDIALVPLGDTVGTRDVGLVWRTTSARADEFRALGDLLAVAKAKSSGT
ncbi:MAG: LysR substrate-binding domain-containing protein [Rhodospirillales bacterium]